MRRINLLYLITKLELGGAQKQLLSLIAGLDKQRFDIFLFTARDGILMSEALSITGLKVKGSRFLERSINPIKDILALIEIYRFIKKHKIDIVHTHSSKAGILGRLAAWLAGDRRIVHTVHGWSFNDYQPAVYRKLSIWLERLVGSFTDRLIVVSFYDKEKGLKNHVGGENKYSYVPYGINFSEFCATGRGIRKEFGINPDDFLVVNISCLKPQKSPLDFIKLASLVSQRIPDLKFLLVGDGGLRKKVEGSIAALNLQKKLFLAGWRRDIPQILSATDILVLTSFWEGLPIVVLEAMAASRLVVATDAGGIREVIRDGKTGFLVAPGDMEGMAEKVTVLLRDAGLRKKIAEAARNSLSPDFKEDAVVKKTADLYEELLK